MNTYNILNRAGNPLLFHAEITLTGLAKQDAPPFSEDAVAPIVWSGSMQWCSFETLEQFIVLIQDAYGAVEGNIKITADEAVYSIHWDCDDGYIANGYKGVKAVNYVADALKSLQAEKEGIALDV